MALFGKKKSEDETPSEAGSAGGAPEGDGQKVQADPVKAARFFDHARTVHDTGNFEYAMTLWLQGLRHDPTSMTGLESFMRSAHEFVVSSKKPGPTKDQLKSFGGRDAIERYLAALLTWGARPTESGAALKAVETAVKLELDEPTYWIGERALNVAARDKKPKKESFVKLKDLLVQVGAFDLAVRAGQAALSLDPSDGPLDAELRNLSAQAAMTEGGYDTTGEAGGFRKNVRDIDQQRRLEEESRTVKSEDAATRVIDSIRAEYEARPTDTNTVVKYARTLLETGREEDEKTAQQVLVTAYEQTKEFRFRQMAGDVNLRRARRKLRLMRDHVKANPDEAKVKQLQEAERKLAEMELKELSLRVEAYPTDLQIKFELGRRRLKIAEQTDDREQYELAIALFQEAQNDPKNRVAVLGGLGQSFLALGWPTEAVESYRAALDAYPTQKDETGLDLRYGLMRALESKAESERDIASADEAARLASGIAMQQISYRDIRDRRDAIQKLLTELKK